MNGTSGFYLKISAIVKYHSRKELKTNRKGLKTWQENVDWLR